MPHRSGRRSLQLIALAGLGLMAAPFVADLAARQGGGGQAPAPMIHTDNLDPRLRGFRWRSIGPTGQGGRIDDLAVDEKNPSTYYIGYAVSGLWKTINNGTTFEPLMDTIAHSIGDIAIAPSDANIVYVGTGEANNRQSSSFGEGVFKSTDAGKTWTFVGLKETQSIARVVVHPKNPDAVWVCAAGHLFGPNAERGVFMSTDGGKSWQHTLRVTQDVGCTDIVLDPSNPNSLMAAMFERRRTSWGFVGGGPGSGIHQSTDGGKTWAPVDNGAEERGRGCEVG